MSEGTTSQRMALLGTWNDRHDTCPLLLFSATVKGLESARALRRANRRQIRGTGCLVGVTPYGRTAEQP